MAQARAISNFQKLQNWCIQHKEGFAKAVMITGLALFAIGLFAMLAGSIAFSIMASSLWSKYALLAVYAGGGVSIGGGLSRRWAVFCMTATTCIPATNSKIRYLKILGFANLLD